MFTENQVARAKYAELEAQYHLSREVEGMPVRLPNIIDRALMALGTFLSLRLAKAQLPGKAMHQSGAIAR